MYGDSVHVKTLKEVTEIRAFNSNLAHLQLAEKQIPNR